MIWVVVAEAVAIVGLALMVVALVHSYAGLAARVEHLHGSRPSANAPMGVPSQAHRVDASVERGKVADHVAGVSPTGEGVVLPIAAVGHDTLLAFLTSTCTSCAHLWQELADATGSVVPDGVRLVVVPKGPEHESPSSILSIAPGGVEVVMSSRAWSDFSVPGSPYFVLVDGASGAVAGEGTALTWAQVVDLMGVSAHDEELGASGGPGAGRPRRDLSREAEVDMVLMRAGVQPGDPSLYPLQAPTPSTS